MSSRCNHCIFESLKSDAKKRNKRLVQVPSKKMGSLGGVEVHELGPGEKPNSKNWRSWMMEITSECCC
jgi:hypothetical protein